MSLGSPRTCCLLLPAVLASALVAQDRVVPTNLTSSEGRASFYYPFIYDAGHFQQIWDGQAVCGASAVINQLSFRRDTTDKSAFPSLVRRQTTVSLGTTPVSPATMTTTFANNLVAAKLTVLVNGVDYTLPAQPAPTSSPAPFNIHYPLSTPYIFLPAQGHLIMDWVVPGQAQSKEAYGLDGEELAVAAGFVRPFGTFGRFSAGDTPTLACDAGKLVPGGALSLTVSGLKSGYTAAAFFGLSDSNWSGLTLPFHLDVIGAPGNWLYTGREIEVVLPVQAAGSTYTAQLVAPLPGNASFAGYRVFVQTWFADAKANALGAVASSALELIGGNGNGYTRSLGIESSTSPTGYFEAGKFGGPVVRFAGSMN